MNAKKRVLVFMLAPPLPAVAGGDIYAVNALIPFAKQVDFHLFCYVSGDSDVRKIEENRDMYTTVFKTIHMEPRPLTPFQMKRIQRAIAMTWLALMGLPFIDLTYYSRSAVTAARRLFRMYDIDALEINSAHLAFFRKFLPKKPAILIGHNIESDIFPFWLSGGRVGWRAKYMNWIANRSRRAAHAIEIENKFDFTAMTFISRKDMERVTSNVPKLLIPLSFPLAAKGGNAKLRDVFNVLWMGGFGWYPNEEGVLWFIREIYPYLRGELKGRRIALHFCGSNPPAELKNLHDGESIFVHGFVDDIGVALKNAHLLMVPLKSGAGIRVKIIEAMSAGVPVLSTSKGCEGIEVESGVNILIEDEPQKFAEKIVWASQNPEKLLVLLDSGLDLMSKNYSIEASLAAKRKAYELAEIL